MKQAEYKLPPGQELRLTATGNSSGTVLPSAFAKRYV